MSNILKNLRTWLQRGNNSAYAVFFLFAFILFLKTMIFHWSCFHSVLLSSLWKHPLDFLIFWGGKIVPVLLIASFVFLTKRQWWTIVVSVFCDLWMIANFFYYKANTLFLSFETMKMIDNLSGFWSSLLSYISLDMFLVVSLTIIYVVIMFYCELQRKNNRQPKIFVFLFLFSLVGASMVNYMYGRRFDTFSKSKNTNEELVRKQVIAKVTPDEDFHYYFPFGNVYFWAKVIIYMDYNAWCNNFVKEYSIISYFPSCLFYSMLNPAGEIIELTDQQLVDINSAISICSGDKHTPKTNLIVILVESFESWPLDDVCGQQFMPFLNNFANTEHVLYCDKLFSQTKHGNSADGQMICATGMLPISNGATCLLYADNLFPNYAHFFNRSAIVNPAPEMWQQSKVTFSYGFKELIEPSQNEQWDDKSLSDKIWQYANNNDSLFCVIGITVSSHVPFAHGSTHPKHKVDGMPPMMSAYLNCLSYTDSCIEVLVNNIMNSDLAANTTIVISGDHTIFRGIDAELDAFAQKSGFSFESGNTRTPLIIYSPLIEGNIHVTDECYQMDIFPTILHLIGCEDYYWHGFGVNLLDEQARNNRRISEQEAYRLSDLMIRSDYFRQYLKKSPQH